MCFIISHTEPSSATIVLDLFHGSVHPWESVVLVISKDCMSWWRNVANRWARNSK